MKIRITNSILIALIINMTYSKAIGVTQGLMAKEAGTDFWIASLISIVQGILLIGLAVYLIKQLPSKDLMQQFDFFVGSLFGKLVSVLIFALFLGAYATIMITFVYHLRDYFLPDLQTFWFILAALMVGIYAVFHGIEVIGRVAILGVFSVMVLNVLLMIGSFAYFDMSEMMPVYKNGLTNTLIVSQHNHADWAVAKVMVMIILPLVKNEKLWMKSSITGVAFAGGLILMWPIFEAGVISPEITGHYFVACMQMARSAEVGLFLHRYELIMVVFFATSILIQIMMCFKCASLAVAHTLKLSDTKVVNVPVAIILSGFAYWVVVDQYRAHFLLKNYWPVVANGITYLLLLLLALFHLLFRKKVKDQQQETRAVKL